MKHSQPIDLTRTHWNWRKDFGRLRVAWISPYNWKLCGAWWWSWYFVFRHHKLHRDFYNSGGYWQLTVLGFQVAYCYRKDFNL